MGIQGLLQALKPFVEPVHVNKYSGQRLKRYESILRERWAEGFHLEKRKVGIDAYSWLHKGAYGCSWQLLREAENQHNSEKLPPYVLYCMHRIKMLQYNNIEPVVVFDGGRLPLKALTEQNRQRGRETNLQKAHQKLAEGDLLSANDHFQKAVEVTPVMAHELIKVLRDEQVEYVVAPYEADAQLAHLASLAPEEGGIGTVITEDSDLLAYGCKVVLFKMDKFGNGEEINLDKVLCSDQCPVAGISFRNFTHDLFLAMCVLAGCDFLASIPGIGVKKAHALLAKYRNVHRVLNKLKFSKHADFPEGYITNFWQAKAIFRHARVYECQTRSLRLLNPLPNELLEVFDGDIEFLGPDLPQSRARAIAEGQLDPTTMCSFDALRNIPSTGSSVLKIPTGESMKDTNKMISIVPNMEAMHSLVANLSKRPEVSLGSCTKSLQSVRTTINNSEEHNPETLDIDDMVMESGRASQLTVSSDTPPEVDQKALAELQFMVSSGLHQERTPQVTTYTQVSRRDINYSGLGHDCPNNNPFRRQEGSENMAHPDIISSSHLLGVRLESTNANSGASVQNGASSLFYPDEDSEGLSASGEVPTHPVPIASWNPVTSLEIDVVNSSCTSSSGEVRTQSALIGSFDIKSKASQSLDSGLTSIFCSSSPMSSEPFPESCTTSAQIPPKERVAQGIRLDSSNHQASQRSINSTGASVLTDISPNKIADGPGYDHTLCQTPRSAPTRSRDPLFPPSGKLGSTKISGRFSKNKSTGGKRSRADSFPQAGSGVKGGIRRFFKPIPTPRKFVLEV